MLKVKSPAHKRILFCAEGNSTIGFGHLSRCRALMELLPTEYVRCLATSSEGIERFFTAADRIYNEGGEDPFEDHRYDIIIIDKENPGSSLINSADSHGERVVALDNYMFSDNRIDVIINLYNQSALSPALFAGEYFEGLSFAIVDLGRFSKSRNELRQHRERVSRVLVIMGGSDPLFRTAEAVRTLQQSSFVSADIVMGPFFDHEAELRAQIGDDRRFCLHRAPDNLAELMVRADAAICGTATVFFELSYLGTPCLVLTQNENEKRFSLHMERHGLTISGDVDISYSWERIQEWRLRDDLGRKQMEIFDGRGAANVLAAIGV
jgi:UDP-2,4-diacetamido-2,4,6-trideoxy-beta-L-altropyranose hydrolase